MTGRDFTGEVWKANRGPQRLGNPGDFTGRQARRLAAEHEQREERARLAAVEADRLAAEAQRALDPGEEPVYDGQGHVVGKVSDGWAYLHEGSSEGA